MHKHNNFYKTKFILAFLVIGLIALGCSSGKATATTGYTVAVSKSVITPGVKEKYTFKYYLNGTLDSGFSCYCQYVSGVTQWVGGGTDSCSGASAVSKAISVSGVGVTANACCKPQPSVNSSLPQPPVNPGASCW